MGPNSYHHDLEAWHRRTKEMRREEEEARLAKRLRVMRRISTGKDVGAAMGFLVASLMVAVLMLVGASSPTHASTTFAVNQTTDVADENLADNHCDINSVVSGDQCTLRAAIQEANDTLGVDTITLPAGTYTLSRAGADEDAASTGDLDVTDELTITGAGARATIVAGGAARFDDQIFENHSTATISGLTITSPLPTATGASQMTRVTLRSSGCPSQTTPPMSPGSLEGSTAIKARSTSQTARSLAIRQPIRQAFSS
jgi:hypothetical protein